MMAKTKPKNENGEHKIDKMPRALKIVALIGALIGAFLLWLYAIGYDDTLFEKSFNGIPVEIAGADALALEKNFTLAPGQDFSSITVTAKGRQADLDKYAPSDFRAVVDISGVESAGEVQLPINVIAPNGVGIVSKSTDYVIVYVDEFVQSSELLTVTVDTGSGYVMTESVSFVDASANPMYVLVSGPKTVLESIGDAVVKFNLDGVTLDKSVYGYGDIILLDKAGKEIDDPYTFLSENRAYVTVTVTKHKTVPVKAMLTGGKFSENDVSITVNPQSVTVSGRAEDLESLNEIVIPIDETAIENIFEADYSILSLLPSGISNESGVSKISVKAILPELTVKTFDIPADKIKIQNVPTGIALTVAEPLKVTLVGPYGAFENFDINDLSATADYNKTVSREDGKYVSAASVTLGGDEIGIYVLNKDYEVVFTELADQ